MFFLALSGRMDAKHGQTCVTGRADSGLDYVFEFAEKHAICTEEGCSYAATDGSWSGLRVCPPTVTALWSRRW